MVCTDLQGINFVGDVSFKCCNLSGANLENVTVDSDLLTDVILAEACNLDGATMPNGELYWGQPPVAKC
jgi:uncharacterized protein YjbI with pentapeptide repeats